MVFMQISLCCQPQVSTQVRAGTISLWILRDFVGIRVQPLKEEFLGVPSGSSDTTASRGFKVRPTLRPCELWGLFWDLFPMSCVIRRGMREHTLAAHAQYGVTKSSHSLPPAIVELCRTLDSGGFFQPTDTPKWDGSSSTRYQWWSAIAKGLNGLF
jgi:hypothetical protein